MLGWEFPPLINGGLGVACHGLSKALTKHVDLTMALPREVPPEANLNLVEMSTSPAPPVEPPPLHPYNDPLYDGNLATRVATYTHATLTYSQETSFDLIHAHDWMTALAGLEIQRATGKPLVFHIHSLTYDRIGPEDRGEIYEIEKRIIAEADLIITVSDYTRDICIQHYEGSPSKIHTVHNGVEAVTPFRGLTPFTEKLIVFLGRLTQQKAPHSFLKIAAQILKTNRKTHFVIAGTGDQLPSLIEESIALGISDHIFFAGFQNRKQVQSLLSQAHVYCMPSLSEPFGISALEAAQFGVPVVLSKQAGVAEVLTHALSADASDLETMAEHIQQLLSDDELHRKTSEALIAEQKICTWERAAEKIHGLYLMHLLSSPSY